MKPAGFFLKIFILLAVLVSSVSCYMQAKVTDYNTLQLDSVIANLANHRQFVFSGACKNSNNVNVRIGAQISKDIQCELGSYSAIIDLSSLADGEYQVEIVGVSDSSLISSYKLIKDIVPPDVSNVTIEDGQGSFVVSKSPLITWSQVIDTQGTGLDRYEICLGLSSGVCDFQNWTSTNQLTFYQYLSILFTRDKTYHVALRAFDRAQNVSAIINGDGFLVHRKLNLDIPEDLSSSYLEGDFYNDGGYLYTGRNGEGGIVNGMFFNYLGGFFISNAISYNSALISKNSRYVLYFEDARTPIETDSLWLFDSVSKSKHYLASSYTEMYNMQFNHAQTKVFYNKIDAGKCSIWSFNLVTYAYTKISDVADDKNCPEDFFISPDDTKLTFVAKKNASTATEAYVVNEDGTNELKISGSIIAGGDVWHVGITNSKVILHGDLETLNRYELWSVNFDGSSRTKLSGAMVANGVIYIYGNNWDLSSDYTKVIFKADKSVDNVDEVWSVNLDGSNLTKLSGALVSGGDVQTLWSVESSYTIFAADKDIDTLNEFYLAKNDGSLLFKLHPALALGGSAKIYLPESVGSDRVLTNISVNAASAKELYSIKTDGTDLKKISVNLNVNEAVVNVFRSYVNDWVFYAVYNSVDDTQDVYRCNSDGSNTVFLKDNYPGEFTLLGITRDDKSLIFSEYDIENYSEKIFFLDADSFSLTMNGYYPAHPNGEIINLDLLSNNTLLRNDNCTLYGYKPDSFNVDLFPWKQANACLDTYWKGNSSNHLIVSGDFETDTKKEIFLIRNGTSTVKEKINDTVISSISTLAISDNRSHLVYIGDSSVLNQKELWYVSLMGQPLLPVKLTGAVPTNIVNIKTLTVRDQGDYAHITAPIDSGLSEVYRVNLTNGTRTKLHPNNLIGTERHSLSANYEKLGFCGSYVAGIEEIRIADATGTSSLKVLEDPNLSCQYIDLVFNASGSRVFFQYNLFNVLYFFSANADASGSYNIGSLLGLPKVFSDYGWIHDDWILILAAIDDVNKYELYKVKFDGSEKVKVSGSLFQGTVVSDVQVFSEVNKVIYMAHQNYQNIKEIYATDITSNVNQKISHELGAGQMIADYQLARNKKYIIYRVVNMDLTQPRWYKYDFTTQQREVLFNDYNEEGDYLGEFIFNDSFNQGILSIRQNFKYNLFNVTF